MKKGKVSLIQSVIILFVVAFSFFVSFFFYSQNKSSLYKNEEDLVNKSASDITRYIISSYNLYYKSGTIKFSEIMGIFLLRIRISQVFKSLM